MSESLFLTGGTGYIGSRLLGRLDTDKYRRVMCLSRVKPRNAPANVEHVQADLLDGKAYSSLLAECDTVLHMAAVTGKMRPEEYFRVNREGTRTLLGECQRAGVKRFVYISSIAAKFRDQNRYYYAQSKREAEELVARSGIGHRIVRPTMVLGKGAPLLLALSRLAAAPVLPIFGNGRALVQPVSVDDLNTSLLEILNDGLESGTVEIGGPQVLSMEELLVKIRRVLGKGGGPVLHLPAKWIAAGVGLVENALLPLLPFTAGQIASFVNDGTASPDPRVAQWQSRMETVDQMLSSANAA